MGLDITAYSNLQKLECVFNEDEEPLHPQTRQPFEYYFQAYINSHFPERAQDLENKAVYLYDDSFGFRAGSYSGYNQWREQLAHLAGYAAKPFARYDSVEMRHDAGAWGTTEGPFWELICFSDCEGVIGPAVCKKLAKDFADFQERAMSSHDDIFRSKYDEWLIAFQLAAENGAVDFR